MKRKGKILSCALSFLLAVGSLTAGAGAAENKGGTMRDMTSQEILEDIRIGINIGNTFDARGDEIDARHGSVEEYERYWSGATITPELPQAMVDKGFRAIRLPVTWGPHMDENNVIDEAWMARIEEVVNYILDTGAYCVLNSHHDTGDNGWLRADAENYDKISARFIKMWEQIAERFKDYGDKLIFEGFNEILDNDNNWGVASAENMETVNRLNQAFVDTVRKSGGNNAVRHLCVNTYAAGLNEDILSYFKMPTDTVENRMFVQVHYYAPLGFCWCDVPWEPMTTKWVENKEKYIPQLEAGFDRLVDSFISKGIPVLIGEFAADNKANTAEREVYVTDYITMAKERGIYCLWWNVNIDKAKYEEDIFMGTCGLIDYNTKEWIFPSIAECLINAACPDKVSAAEFTVSEIPDQKHTGKPIEPEIEVTYNGETLVRGVDYNVSYKNNVKPGQATVTIIGIGDYFESAEVTFNIVGNIYVTIGLAAGAAAAAIAAIALVLTKKKKKK